MTEKIQFSKETPVLQKRSNGNVDVWYRQATLESGKRSLVVSPDGEYQRYTRSSELDESGQEQLARELSGKHLRGDKIFGLVDGEVAEATVADYKKNEAGEEVAVIDYGFGSHEVPVIALSDEVQGNLEERLALRQSARKELADEALQHTVESDAGSSSRYDDLLAGTYEGSVEDAAVHEELSEEDRGIRAIQEHNLKLSRRDEIDNRADDHRSRTAN